MKIQITEDMKKRIIVNSLSLIIPLLLFVFLDKFKVVKDALQTFLQICLPFVIGISIAFILYKPQTWIENKFFQNSSMSPYKKRIFSTLITFLVVLFVLGLILSIIIPSIIDSIHSFILNVGVYMDTLTNYAISIATSLNISPENVQSMINELNIVETITETVTTTLPKLASYSYGIVRAFIDIILAIVSGFYILLDREKLIRVIKKINYALLDNNTAKNLNNWILDVQVVFEQYIVGNIIDSTIIGMICYLGTLLLRIPYAPMISLIVGVTNLIPVFGPFLGAIPVIIILLLINPLSALIFAVFILILQQLDGNVIKPIVLGDKLGMSGFWILFSVTVGGGLFNIVGMFLGVPVFALIYSAVREFVQINLKNKHIEV